MTALILGYLLSVAPHQAVLPHLAVLVALGADSCRYSRFRFLSHINLRYLTYLLTR